MIINGPCSICSGIRHVITQLGNELTRISLLKIIHLWEQPRRKFRPIDIALIDYTQSIRIEPRETVHAARVSVKTILSAADIKAHRLVVHLRYYYNVMF